MLGRWAASHFITFLVQAAIGAASGNHGSKDWARAVPYYELSLGGVRKYYQPYCGYLGSTLEKYAECLFLSGNKEKVTNYSVSNITQFSLMFILITRRGKSLRRQIKS